MNRSDTALDKRSAWSFDLSHELEYLWAEDAGLSILTRWWVMVSDILQMPRRARPRGHLRDACLVTNVTAHRYCMGLGLLMLIKSYCSPRAMTKRKWRSRGKGRWRMDGKGKCKKKKCLHDRKRERSRCINDGTHKNHAHILLENLDNVAQSKIHCYQPTYTPIPYICNTLRSADLSVQL